ncbi:MAG: translation initiation factor 2 [Oscillospiraceae bacterium]|nr:translation initiation factor 2 [Oscillospiraceae bacterium]
MSQLVKGVSKRVIVVKSPDPRLFEQAIFIMKEDVFHQSGVSADQILKEAQQVASGYARRNTPLRKTFGRIPAPFYAAAGALAATAAWAAALYF